MLWIYIFAALSFITAAVKEGVLKAFKNEAPPKYEKVYVKLYKGNPGEAGTENAAGETKRKQVTLTGTSILKNSVALKWENVSTAETYKYIGFWTAEEGGTFLGYTVLEAEQTVANAEFAVEAFSWTVV
jgi:hypothetical protein